MLQIKLFASLRDTLGTSELSLAFDNSMLTTGSLRQVLSQRSDAWQTAFASAQLLVAVNQEMANWQTPLTDGDEVAFFPPVTGG